MASPAPSSTAQIARARLGLDGEEGAGGLLTEIGPAWTAFFKLKRPDWALGEVVLLWLSLVALIVGLAPISSFAIWLIVPYLLWVTFAAWLNLAVVRLNAPFHAEPAGSPEATQGRPG